MPDYRLHLVLIHEMVGDGDGLLRLAGVVALDQFDLLAVDPARGVHTVHIGRDAVIDLFAENGVGAGKRTGDADLDRIGGVCLGEHQAGRDRGTGEEFCKTFHATSLWLALRARVPQGFSWSRPDQDV